MKIHSVTWSKGYNVMQGTPVQETEKAVKLKIESSIAYPGVNDSPAPAGFTWVPKSALYYAEDQPKVEGHYDLKNWMARKVKIYYK